MNIRFNKKYYWFILCFIFILGLIVFCFMSCGENKKKPSIEKQDAVNIQAQKSLDYPYGKKDVLASLPNNSQETFMSYSGQGNIYVKTNPEVKSFSLFINNKEIDTSELYTGDVYKINVSELTNNGINYLQVSNISPNNLKNTVHVDIDYPEIVDSANAKSDMYDVGFKAIEETVKADIDNGFTSAQIAIIKDGKLVYNNAFGKKNSYNPDGTINNDSENVTTDTLYDLASNTKMYATNYAIQYLVSNNKINLNTRLVDIFGSEFANNVIDITYKNYPNPGIDKEREWKSRLKITDILHHQAGFPADPRYFNDKLNQSTEKIESNGVNQLYAGANGDEQTKQATLQAIFKTPLMYEPGTNTIYSDVDYMLLGFIVEKVTGQSLDKFCNDVFYKPLGFDKITFNPLKNGFKKEDCAATELNGNTRDGAINFTNARTYTLQGETHDEKAYYSMGGVSGHAGLFANAEQLAKLASIMITGGYGNNRFFNQDVIDIFSAPADSENFDFGLGWNRRAENKRNSTLSSYASNQAIGHTGWTGTSTMIDRSTNTVCVVLTNKINSPVVNKEKFPNTFYGNFFTSASLGIVSEIFEMVSNNCDNVNDAKNACMHIMADCVSSSVDYFKSNNEVDKNSSNTHPAIRNIYAKAEACMSYSKWISTNEAKDLAKKSIECLDSCRDKDEIDKLSS